MARYEFKLPDIGEGIAEAEIVAWHVKVGDQVEEDQRLADVMTDKATVEMEAPVSGRIVELAGGVGDQIPIGTVLVVFETDGAGAPEVPKPAAKRAKPSKASNGKAGDDRRSGDRRGEDRRDESPDRRSADRGWPDRRTGQRRGNDRRDTEADDQTPAKAESGRAGKGQVTASPAVRQRARDLGIDLALVRSAGGDRVRHSDLDAYLLYHGGAVGGAPTAERPDEEVKVAGLRRRIAENMQEAKRRIPHFSYVEEVDVSALEATRTMMNADRGDHPKLTVLPFLVTALCRALADYPQINARYDDEAEIVTRHGAVHIGIATQTDAGLAVPVVRNAHRRGIWELATEIRRLAEAARAGKAAREELSGSTITISSLGPLGGIAATPVINRPEVAILAVNKIVERPVVVEGRVEIRKMMNLSSSFDHRVVDGWEAASFIQEVKRLVEQPLLLLSLR
jgi:2-oxoisovalerate dehydrogenase E2 component (dihydrolipoyl transacylase)